MTMIITIEWIALVAYTTELDAVGKFNSEFDPSRRLRIELRPYTSINH